MPHMSLQSLHLFGHGVEVFSIILLPRGLHSPKSGTGSSSSSDDSLLTDTGQLSLQPYMHEPPATYRRKVDKSASQHTMGLAITDSLNSDSVDERHRLVCDFPLCPHIVSDVS